MEQTRDTTRVANVSVATRALSLVPRTAYFRNAAWAAARRAIGTRNGEQLT